MQQNIVDTDNKQNSETGRIIVWASLVMAVIIGVGLAVWSRAGTAVYFDRLSAAIVNCF